MVTGNLFKEKCEERNGTQKGKVEEYMSTTPALPHAVTICCSHCLIMQILWKTPFMELRRFYKVDIATYGDYSLYSDAVNEYAGLGWFLY